jgi:hypothetical protein
MCLHANLLPCNDTVCLVVGKKTYPLPKGIATILINFTIINTKEGENELRPITDHGVTIRFEGNQFVIDYKKIRFCVTTVDVLELVKMYKKMGLPLPDLFEKDSFKRKAQKTISQGLENLGFKKPDTFQTFSRPSAGHTIKSGLEKLGLRKRK